MERKIGEIFEYKGEWYQCVEDTEDISCVNCCFYNGDIRLCTDEDMGACAKKYRSDAKSICFKKLEKVGEPYNIGTHIYQRYKVFMKPYIFNDSYFAVNPAIDDEFINIEVKQNKEDMEEKKQKLDKLVDDYMACRIQYAEFDKEIKALYDKEESEPTLTEFDLEAAKAGKPVCTRDGRKARIICFDVKGDICPIIALVEENGMEVTKSYDMNGRVNYKDADNYDLMMLPEKKEGWAVIRRSDIYETEEKAKEVLFNSRTAVMIKKISWEE